jgi:predicted ATPase with chaperone activity
MANAPGASVQGYPAQDAEVRSVQLSQIETSKGAALLAACQLGTKERSWLELVSERYQLSGRGIMSALAVSRTIADMEESERVLQEHLLEAVSFRVREAM